MTPMEATEPATEPRLGPNFARGVLERADVIIARRRRIRQAAGVAGASIVAVLGLLVARSQMTDVKAPGTSPTEITARADDATIESLAATERQDALGFMFPDAVPVARFADSYADTMSGSNNDLFAQDSGTTDTPL